MGEQERTTRTVQATMKLRILVRDICGIKSEVLQQAWVCIEDGSIEWRDVEKVREAGNGN